MKKTPKYLEQFLQLARQDWFVHVELKKALEDTNAQQAIGDLLYTYGIPAYRAYRAYNTIKRLTGKDFYLEVPYDLNFPYVLTDSIYNVIMGSSQYGGTMNGQTMNTNQFSEIFKKDKYIKIILLDNKVTSENIQLACEVADKILQKLETLIHKYRQYFDTSKIPLRAVESDLYMSLIYSFDTYDTFEKGKRKAVKMDFNYKRMIDVFIGRLQSHIGKKYKIDLNKEYVLLKSLITKWLK